jgi:hypothetical protein
VDCEKYGKQRLAREQKKKLQLITKKRTAWLLSRLSVLSLALALALILNGGLGTWVGDFLVAENLSMI